MTTGDRLARTARSILTEEPWAAVAIRVAAETSTVTFGCTEGRAYASQTEDAAKASSGDGFEGLATGSSSR